MTPTLPDTVRRTAARIGLSERTIQAALEVDPDTVDWTPAPCRHGDPDAFFPEKGSVMSSTLCGACPLTTQCLAAGLGAADVHHGWWGGVSAKKRSVLREVLVAEGLMEPTWPRHNSDRNNPAPLRPDIAARIAALSGQTPEEVMAVADEIAATAPASLKPPSPPRRDDEVGRPVTEITAAPSAATAPPAAPAFGPIAVELTGRWAKIHHLPSWPAGLTGEGPYDHDDAQLLLRKRQDGSVDVLARKAPVAA